MTLVYELDLHIPAYKNIKMNVSGQDSRNLALKQDTQTRFCSGDLDIDPMTLL